MATIFNSVITAAQTLTVGNTWQFKNPGATKPRSLFIQGSLVFGSGGSTVQAWVQTSFDGGGSFWDVASFGFAAASLRRGFNVSALTPKTTLLTPTSGTLTADTCNDGILGPQWRVLVTSTGTYAASTRLIIDLDGDIAMVPK